MSQLTPLTTAIAFSDGLDHTVKVSCRVYYGKKQHVSELFSDSDTVLSLHQHIKHMPYEKLFMLIYLFDRCGWCVFVSLFVFLFLFLLG